jgi:hypothetical protein
MFMRMTFGKHNGRLLTDVPTGYLRWLLRECDNLEPRLREGVLWTLRDRGVPAKEEPPEHYAPPARVWEPLVKVWFTRLARKWHPDRGGDGKAMAALNDARALLVELLRPAG